MFPLNKAFRFRFWPPLPSFRPHTHTHTHPHTFIHSKLPLLRALIPTLLLILGLPYFVSIAGGFVAVSLRSPPFICSIVKLVVSARQLIMIIMVAAAFLHPSLAAAATTYITMHLPGATHRPESRRKAPIQWIDGNFFQSACKWLWILIKKQVACAVHLMSLMLGRRRWWWVLCVSCFPARFLSISPAEMSLGEND